MMTALIDCNNFFVSCELTVRPELRGRPVVVGGRGDSGGCVVAMSNEAKALGITRGVPIFRIKEIVAKHGVVVLPADHKLYSQVSARVMNTLRSLNVDMEVYSIDEAFLHIDLIGTDAVDFCRYVRELLIKRIGIGTGIGIGPTKTLAKIAARFAKRYTGYQGVCMIDTPEKVLRALTLTPAAEVWGIGRKLRKRLEMIGVRRAIDFYNLDRDMLLRSFPAPVFATWEELHGIYRLDETTHRRRYLTCTCSRTFDHDTYDFGVVSARVACYAASVARSLRRHNRLAGEVEVMLATNPYRTQQPQRSHTVRYRLDSPSADTREIASAAARALEHAWADGYAYKRAGVTATATIDANLCTASLFDDRDASIRARRLMKTVDKLNARCSGSVKLASTIEPSPKEERPTKSNNNKK